MQQQQQQEQKKQQPGQEERDRQGRMALRCALSKKKCSTFGRRVGVELMTVAVSRKTIPSADSGTMSIDGGGELSLDQITWATSINYVVGAVVWARGTSGLNYEETTVLNITGIGFTDTFTIITRSSSTYWANDGTWNDLATWDDADFWNDSLVNIWQDLENWNDEGVWNE